MKRKSNRNEVFHDDRYLEVNPDHLARFLAGVGGGIEVDRTRVAELLRMQGPCRSTLRERARPHKMNSDG